MTNCENVVAGLFESLILFDAESLDEKLKSCRNFAQLCKFHDQNENAFGYQELFKKQKTSPAVYFYFEALKESIPCASYSQELQSRFGDFWGEEILEFILAAEQETAQELISFCTKEKTNLVLRHEKEKELIDRIENSSTDNGIYERIWDLFEGLSVRYEASNSSITRLIHTSMEKLFAEDRPALIKLIGKSNFSSIWEHLKVRKVPFSQQFLCWVHMVWSKQSLHLPNRFIKSLTGSLYEEIIRDVRCQLDVISTDPVLTQPKHSVKPIECIHVGGVCTGTVHQMAKEAFSIWDEKLFPEALLKIAMAYSTQVSKEVYTTHLVYSKLQRQEFQWRGLLHGLYREIETTSSHEKALVFLFLSVAYDIRKEKILNFMRECGCSLQDIHCLESLFSKNILEPASRACGHLKSTGCFDEQAVELLSKELEESFSTCLTAVQQTVKSCYYAHKLCGRAFSSVHLSEDLQKVAKKIYQRILVAREEVQSYSKPVDKALAQFLKQSLEEVPQVQATDDFTRWKEWVETAHDGIYHLVLPRHRICLVKREKIVYVLDPSFLLNEKEALVQFEAANQKEMTAHYDMLVRRAPLHKKHLWQFSKVVAKIL